MRSAGFSDFAGYRCLRSLELSHSCFLLVFMCFRTLGAYDLAATFPSSFVLAVALPRSSLFFLHAFGR
jgi:hypothetical protein